MCDECLQSPCHPRCPNADQPEYFRCAMCGMEIIDDVFYTDNEFNYFCSESCALEFHGIEAKFYDEDGDTYDAIDDF